MMKVRAVANEIIFLLYLSESGWRLQPGKALPEQREKPEVWLVKRKLEFCLCLKFYIFSSLDCFVYL